MLYTLILVFYLYLTYLQSAIEFVDCLEVDDLEIDRLKINRLKINRLKN